MKRGKFPKSHSLVSFRHSKTTNQSTTSLPKVPINYLFHSVEEQPVKVAIPKALGQTQNQSKTAPTQAKKKATATVEQKSTGGNLFLLMGTFVTLILIGVLIFVMVIL